LCRRVFTIFNIKPLKEFQSPPHVPPHHLGRTAPFVFYFHGNTRQLRKTNPPDNHLVDIVGHFLRELLVLLGVKIAPEVELQHPLVAFLIAQQAL
jgi:hypothetical protein